MVVVLILIMLFVLDINNQLIFQWGLYVKSKPASSPININLPVSINTKILNAIACINYTVRSSHSGCATVYVCSDLFTVTNITINPDWTQTNLIDSIYWFCIGF